MKQQTVQFAPIMIITQSGLVENLLFCRLLHVLTDRQKKL